MSFSERRKVSGLEIVVLWNRVSEAKMNTWPIRSTWLTVVALSYTSCLTAMCQAPPMSKAADKSAKTSAEKERENLIAQSDKVHCVIEKISVYNTGVVFQMSLRNDSNANIRIRYESSIFGNLGTGKYVDDKGAVWALPPYRRDYYYGAPTVDKTFLISKGKTVRFSVVSDLEQRRLVRQDKSVLTNTNPCQLNYEIGCFMYVYSENMQNAREVYFMGHGKVTVEWHDTAIQAGLRTKIVEAGKPTGD